MLDWLAATIDAIPEKRINAVTYPWTALIELPASNLASNQFAAGNLESETLRREYRDPETLGMLAIEGNEFEIHTPLKM